MNSIASINNNPSELFEIHFKPNLIASTTFEKIQVESFAGYIESLGDLAPIFEEQSDVLAERLQTIEIPQIFFNSYFNLSKESFFEQIINCDMDEVVDKLDILTVYLDIAENKLTKEIISKKDEIFSAMILLQEFKTQILSLIIEIEDLRHAFKKIDLISRIGFAIEKLICRKNNFALVENVIKDIITIKNSHSAIEILTANAEDNKNYANCLEIIIETENIIAERLEGIMCLNDMRERMKFMKIQVENSSTSELETLLIDILNESDNNLMSHMSRALVPSMKILIRSKRLNAQAMKSETQIAVRKTFDKLVEGLIIEELETVDYLSLIKRMFEESKVLLEKIVGYIIPAFESSLAESTTDISELSEVKQEIIEEIQSQIAITISRRMEKNLHLSFDDLGKLTMCSLEWIGYMDRFYPESNLQSMRLSLDNLGKCFLEKFHDDKKKEVSLLIETERWIPVEIPAVMGRTVYELCQIEFLSEADLLDFVEIQGEKYHLTSVSLLFFKVISSYLSFIQSFSLIAFRIANRLIELMRYFNLKICQSILGASAIKTAGLKSVTAKHIALASRTVSLTKVMLRNIEQRILEFLEKEQTAIVKREFERLFKDFEEHENELLSKFLSIMLDRFTIHSKSFVALDWKFVDTVPSKPLTLLLKETATLHKVISQYLPHSVVNQIFQKLVTEYYNSLKTMISFVELKTKEQKQLLIKDVEIFTEEMDKFSEEQNDGSLLEATEKAIILS